MAGVIVKNGMNLCLLELTVNMFASTIFPYFNKNRLCSMTCGLTWHLFDFIGCFGGPKTMHCIRSDGHSVIVGTVES